MDKVVTRPLLGVEYQLRHHGCLRRKGDLFGVRQHHSGRVHRSVFGHVVLCKTKGSEIEENVNYKQSKVFAAKTIHQSDDSNEHCTTIKLTKIFTYNNINEHNVYLVSPLRAPGCPA